VLVDLAPKVLEQMIIKYVIYLRDTKEKQRGRRKLKSTLSSTAIKPKSGSGSGTGLSRASIEAECAAIFHFFDMNDSDLSNRSKKRIKRFLPPDESTHDDRVYTQVEKERILSECDKRARVVILLMNSGGIRIGAINKLTIGSLEPVGSKEGYYKIIVDGRSRKDRYFTVCNPECFNAIRDYLEYRERLGEDVTKRSSPLIREQCDPDADTRMPWPRSLKENTIRHIVIDVLKRSGVKTSEAMMSHAFRKNFKTVCEESGMKSLHVEMLMGHHVPLNKSYMRPKDSEVIQDYIDHAVDALTINQEHTLKKKVQQLESERTQEIAQLKNQLREYKEFANKTAAEISDLKASRGDIHNWESTISWVDPNFSNIINALNETRAKDGLAPVAIITPEDKEAKAARIRYHIRCIKQSIENRRRGIPEECPHPESIMDKESQIKELEHELTQIEARLKD
jgi:site-specific recombinase XerD